jgi:6-pyruvoyl-tetrahydropterin synthase
VRDFSDFKPMKNWIDENLDHATIISSEDIEVAKFLKETRQKTFIMKENPTSENLCKLIYYQSHILGIPVTAVEIDETCTSNSRYFE